MKRRRRLRRWVIVTLTLICLGILGGLGAGSFFFFSQKTSTTQRPATPTPVTPEFKMLIVQEDGDDRRVLQCDAGKCSAQDLPSSVDDSAVFDGQSLYFYVLEGTKKNPRKILRRKDLKNNQETTVIEETPLVRPRDLIISPDGQKIMFWLDNIDNKKEELTELWMYDAREGSTRLLVEKVVRDTVLTQARWNRLGNYVWFVVQPESAEQPVLQVVNTQPIDVQTRFSELNWQDLNEQADSGLMDMSFNGEALAYVDQGFPFTRLHIIYQDHPELNNTVTGAVQYIQWLPDGTMIYVIKESKSFTLWRLSGTVHQFITRQPGVFEAARLDEDTGEYVGIIVSGGSNSPDIAILDMSTSVVVTKHALPPFGTGLHLAQFSSTDNDQSRLNITAPLDDEALTAFIQTHIADIVGLEEEATLNRMITTRQVNTLYADYRDEKGTEHRLLITVRDALNPEWTIKSRYIKRKGEWQKIEGSALSDPAPYKLYEWETSLKRWILKSDAPSGQEG